MTLFSACNQMDGQPALQMKIGDAVANVLKLDCALIFLYFHESLLQKIVDNETLGYYMARTHLFLIKVGVDPRRLRFRQHLANEMAHYAQVSNYIEYELIISTCLVSCFYVMLW